MLDMAVRVGWMDEAEVKPRADAATRTAQLCRAMLGA